MTLNKSEATLLCSAVRVALHWAVGTYNDKCESSAIKILLVTVPLSVVIIASSPASSAIASRSPLVNPAQPRSDARLDLMPRSATTAVEPKYCERAVYASIASHAIIGSLKLPEPPTTNQQLTTLRSKNVR